MEIDCAQVVVASLPEAISGQDPLALGCAIARARDAGDSSAAELEFAETIRLGMTLTAGEFVLIADDWLSQNETAPAEWRRAVMWSASAAHEWLLDFDRASELARRAVEIDETPSDIIRRSRQDSAEVAEIMASAGGPELVGGLEEISVAKINRHGYWLLRIPINGRPASVIIDTGSPDNLVAQEDAGRLNLELISSSTEYRRWGGRRKIPYMRARQVEFDGALLKNAVFKIEPGAQLHPWTTAVIGASLLFLNRTVAWEKSTRKIFFGDKARLRSKCLTHHGRLYRAGPGSFLIEAEVGGRPVLLILDTGGQTMYFTPRFDRYIPAQGERPRSRGEGDVFYEGRMLRREFEIFRHLEIDLAGAKLKLKRAPGYMIGEEVTQLGPIGTLGVGELKQLELFAIDFDSMTYLASKEGCA